MTTTITISKKTYEALFRKKMRRSSKLGRPVTWDEFFDKRKN